MLITINYDGINIENENATNEFIDAYYDRHMTGKSVEVIETKSGDIYESYDAALEMSDHRLSIDYMEIYLDGAWQNIHTLLGTT